MGRKSIFNFLITFFTIVQNLSTHYAVCESNISIAETDNEIFDYEVIPEGMEDILTEEIANWEVPQYIRENFVYYHSGWDEEKRPIWIIETGKWDIRSMIEGGQQRYDEYDKFISNGIFTVMNSTRLTSTPEDPVTQVVIIMDMEGYNLNQLNSIPTVGYILKSFRKFIPAFVKLHYASIVNANFLAETVINLFRPLLGREFDKVDVYGLNKAKWIPKLLKVVPRDQLPEWYGGVKDYMPIRVYG